MLKALADETRLRALRVLRSGPFNVNELVRILEVGQSRISRHLRILLDAGLVEARREGSWVYYRHAAAWSGKEAGSPGRFLRVLSREIGALDGEEHVRDDAGVERCLDARRQRAEQFFKEIAEDFDAAREQIQGPADHVAKLVELLDGADAESVETLVDLGTGTGVLLETLSHKAERVIGVDAAAEMLDVARGHSTRRGLKNVDLRLGTLEHLPLPDGEADVMVANMVLHHVAHPPDALREARRGLRNDGRLLVADFAAHSEESYRERLGDLWLGFELEEISRWLDEAEFDLAESVQLPPADHRPGVLLLEARRRS